MKFAYPNMLVGAAAMRALLGEALRGERIRRQIDILKAAARSAWETDKVVGFRQAGLDGVPLDSLFVDVPSRLEEPGRVRSNNPTRGALEYLLSEDGAVMGKVVVHP